MRTDYTFASALLSTKSASLLIKAQFRELRNADDDGFILKLQSFGYGVGEQPKAVEAIVGAEVFETKKRTFRDHAKRRFGAVFFYQIRSDEYSCLL
jgi:hypothetical protein